MTVYQSITATIGRTPLVELKGLAKHFGFSSRILGKLDSFNPGSSVKDRVALAMIDDAEARGILKPGATIIEPTSGNTGIGLALVARSRGYRAVLTMPETMSIERRKLLIAYGAELVLTEGAKGMSGAIAKAKELLEQTPGAFMPMQFENPANPQAHYRSTGPEIWTDTEGKVDVFVAGVGTGGTVSGTGKYLKEQNPSVRVVAVEPASSAVLSGNAPGPHKIQGIGAGFVPKTFDRNVVDEIVAVSNEDAFEFARLVSRTDSVLVGISSGAALAAAVKLALADPTVARNIAVMLPDSGERYLSTTLFED
ncbi:MAG: cysteine synthase A [Sutterellaceae bacterium]|nr:cysteine synthase A [Sutterellaceae bacterium]